MPETLAVYKDGQSHWFQRGGQGGSAKNINSVIWLARQKESSVDSIPSQTVFVFCCWSTLLVKENHLIGALPLIRSDFEEQCHEVVSMSCNYVAE